MVRLGDVCEISSSKANLTDDKIWLLNLDMVEQQTGKIISYYYVNKNELNGSITQFDTENMSRYTIYMKKARGKDRWK